MSETPELYGDGLLGKAPEEWVEFLSELGRDKEARGAFVARNAILDEGVLESRRNSYDSVIEPRHFGTIDAWEQRHNLYLQEAVFLDSDEDGPPEHLRLEEEFDVPETFRDIDPDSPFLKTDPETMLIRLEELQFLADSLGEDAESVRSVLEAHMPWSKKDPATVQQVDAWLSEWHRQLDQRPVYTMFWEDVSDLFSSEDPEDDADGWADTLRDRMGLLHFDPGARGRDLEVVVFRYPLKHVPRILGTGGKRRPLVTPTVLDGRLSEAFCPAPRGSTTGHVVNLDPEAGHLRREVLHPRPRYRHFHLWRLGRLTRAVVPGKLPQSRAFHLLHCRNEHDRGDYAAGTDGDLW